MFRNYLITAYRNILKNRLFAVINILGLAIGLTVFMLAQLITEYEKTHDTFFEKSDRIHVISAAFNPAGNFGVRTSVGVHTPIASHVRESVPAAETTARLYNREYLARAGDDTFYQSIRFAEDGFLEIFNFDFIRGSATTSLRGPTDLILTESSARKFFGNADPMGRTITVDRNQDLTVTGVIRDLPRNSHFTTSLVFDNATFEMIARADVYYRISGFDAETSWGNMTSSHVTYALLRDGVTLTEADDQLADLYDAHVPEREKDVISSLRFMPIHEFNLYPWEASGIPAILAIQALGILVLLIASLNYTNLATAQVMGRTREVALRKTMGAGKKQLFGQFIAESVLVALAAFLITLALIDVALPIINDASGKAMNFGLLASPMEGIQLFVTVILVGVLSGAYPALMIARGGTVKMLNGEFSKGRSGGWVRSTLLVLQFAISIFMAVVVSIIYAQNQNIVSSSDIFDKDRLLLVERVQQDGIRENQTALSNEFNRIPGVNSVAFISMPPFEQSNSDTDVSVQPGDEAGLFPLSYLLVDGNFMDALGMSVLNGRRLSEDLAEDRYRLDDDGDPIPGPVNVIINETAAAKFGVTSPADALGESFYTSSYLESGREYRVVGIVPDINYRGFQNRVRPLMFMWYEQAAGTMMVRIEAGATPGVVDDIDRVWEEIIPDYPIERRFLSEIFDETYGIYKSVTGTVAAFAAIALMLALFGLFGLAAIMAAKRTKEVGIRKVLGAGITDIVRLLTWQFTTPVVIGFILALVPGYFGAKAYLDFFPDRVGLTPLPFLVAGGIALLFAWITVAGHAIRVARSNPVHALRYE